MKSKKRENLSAIVLAIVLCFLTYMVIMTELPKVLSDYNGHTYVYLPMFTSGNWVQGWKTVPYCMWHLIVLGLNGIIHIPLEVAVAYSSCFFVLLSYFVIYWMILRYSASFGSEENTVKAAFVAFGFCVVQALYFFWLDAGNRFLGSYSMNPIHNPTHMSVRPFSLLCFCLVYDIWRKQKDSSYTGVFFDMKNGMRKPYIYLAVVLLLSSAAKPTFAEMFIPAVGIIMLYRWVSMLIKKDTMAKAYFKHCLHMFLCAIPALLYILLQFLAYFIWGGSYGADGGFMITKWLEVWSMYTENVILSIALGLAFPLFIMFIDVRFFLEDELGKLALTGYVIGFLEAALLGEGGQKLSHADFLWPMMSGMLLMFTAALLHLLALERTQNDTTRKCISIDIGWFLFCAHVFCGLLYINSLIIG